MSVAEKIKYMSDVAEINTRQIVFIKNNKRKIIIPT